VTWNKSMEMRLLAIRSEVRKTADYCQHDTLPSMQMFSSLFVAKAAAREIRTAHDAAAPVPVFEEVELGMERPARGRLPQIRYDPTTSTLSSIVTLDAPVLHLAAPPGRTLTIRDCAVRLHR